MACSKVDEKCNISLCYFLYPLLVISFLVHLGCLFCGFAIIFVTSVTFYFGILTVGGVGKHVSRRFVLSPFSICNEE